MLRDNQFKRIAVSPLTGALGAEVHGIDLAAEPDEASFAELRHALNTYHVLAVREQRLTPESYKRAAARFGAFSPNPVHASMEGLEHIIRFVRAPVTTVGTGWVASAGTHVFLAAPRERRLCLPNTRFMIHQPGGGAGGPATDIAIQAKEILRTRERIAKVISRQTGQSLQKVLADMERDFWMSAEEAIDYGLVSRIIESSRQLG